jgi:hypothetical protein
MNMKIPEMPDISIDVDEESMEFLQSLDDRLDSIEVARVEGDELHVLGVRMYSFFHNFEKEYFEITQNRLSGEVSETSFKGLHPLSVIGTLGLYRLLPNVRKRHRQTVEFAEKIERYRDANIVDIEEKIKGIKLYQGSTEEVERELGMPLERVDTGQPETFLNARDTVWLRVQAYLKGADAI